MNQSNTAYLIPRLAFVAALCGAPILTAYAEEGAAGISGGDKSMIAFGLHGGANFSDFSVSADSGSELFEKTKSNRVGYLLGAHVELGLTEQFVIRPELNYSVKGYDFANVAEVTQRYLEIPVLAKFNFLTGNIRPYLELGPQFSLHVGSSVSALGGTINFQNTADAWDFSGVAGAGVGFGISDRLIFSAEVRYLFGLKDLDSGNDVSVRSGGFQTLVGVTFTN